MENYKEEYNVGTEEFPRMKDRLGISAAHYGHRLYDRKTKKNLLLGKPLEICEEGRTLLLTSEFHFFESFKERVKHDYARDEGRVMKIRGKHSEDYYYIRSVDELYKVCLHLVEQRLEMNYIQKWDEIKPLYYTLADIEKIPETLREEPRKKLRYNQDNIREVKQNNEDFDLAHKAVEEKNGKIAWSIINNRQGYEYEEYETLNIDVID